MTTVNISLRKRISGGTVPAAGKLLWQPTSRQLAGDDIILPDSFEVPLVLGAATVDVAATGDTWVWRVTEVVDGQAKFTRFVIVPASGTVAYADLVDVNPASLDPAAVPEPMWVEMANSTVSSGEVNEAGNLLLERTDGTVVNAGYVVGPEGQPGPANQITIGVVTEGPSAAASLYGTAPNQTLNLQLPVMSDSAHALALAYATVL
jgi:hypothetical protein